MRLGPKTALVMVVAVLGRWNFGQVSNVASDPEGLKYIPMAESLNVNSSKVAALLPPLQALTLNTGLALQTRANKVLVVSVPEGGTVGTVSKKFSCGAGETCEIQIDDGFDEVFIPQYKVGYRFSSWKQSSEHFCGGQIANCTITAATADSLSRLEPVFDKDVASTGYKGIRKLDYSDMDFVTPAQAHADFDGNGLLDLFRAIAHPDSVERNPVEMWLGNGDGTYRRDDGMLVDAKVGGFHPRKAVVADFNGDNKADVIVADHGYDVDPWPGAPLLLYLSTTDGRLEKAKGLEHTVGYHHTVAVGDLDRDGDTDAFVTDHLAMFLINDGKGNMTVTRAYLSKRFPMDHANYFTSELIDVDRDGHLDLLLARHGPIGEPSLILWGNEEPGFADSTATILPEVPDFSTVVDIDVADFDGDGINDVLLNRVGSAPGRGWYDGPYLQLLKGHQDRYTFSDITDSSIDNQAILDTYGNGGVWWFQWLIAQDWDFDGDLDILVADLICFGPPCTARNDQGLVFINNGQSVFSILNVDQP